MAKKALMKIGDRYTEVDAANPDLPPHGEYYCSGTCDGGKMCMCPVTLIVPDDGDIVRHFRRTQQNVSHGKGCTHADESPFRFVDHLDHSGADMIDQDILKIGQSTPRTGSSKTEHGTGGEHTRAAAQDREVEDDHRQQVQRLTKPHNIYQLYLVLSDPETKMYAGRKKAELIVNKQTSFFHRGHPGDGIMLVVAELKFGSGPKTPPEKACIVFRDTHFVPGQVQDRLTFVVEFDDNTLYQKVRTACKATTGNFGQKYLLLGDWHYDAATNAYYTTLTSWGHFKVLKADHDVEA